MKNFMKTKEFIGFCKNVFDKLPVPVDFLDKEGRLVYINKSFLEFLKFNEDDILGKVVTEIEPTSKFLETLKYKQAEVAKRHVFSNGKEAIVHRIPIIDENDELIGGFGMILFDNYEKLKQVTEKIEKIHKELSLYKNELAKINSAKYTLDDIIGESKAIKSCKSKVKKLARVNSNILIIGESGVGKELFAHAIHYESERRECPFVSINCSAIPENLFEAEFFGYEDGAFTGARKGGNIGKFELANGGTIFLDEIGDMPLYMQAKLLRVLQEKEIVRVGSNKVTKLDVRVICATHKNLESLVDEGKFREDLYYRLNVLSLDVPPLRQRKEDISILIDKFTDKFYKDTGLYREVPSDVMNILCNYEWPGNVRELKNIVERICVNAEDTYVTVGDLPSNILNKSLKIERKKSQGLKEIMDNIEMDIIINTLKECNNNKSLAATRLNIPRASLYRKIEEYNIEI
ncbi:transcriptional regulator [Fervidicella metallireducens AeB]|uniref:Transcriptional regulator n=1 Tax=Fervidicella metallireducens AeB TaxID=1403537 RepID=A0A017RS49_9CLOT|nr:sigma-54-dependent Fis family transcriptional regulator [Fervidicella metallireducens]EYE87426.1 transcriptional regulator [Fervidicella metallireducens AeB]